MHLHAHAGASEGPGARVGTCVHARVRSVCVCTCMHAYMCARVRAYACSKSRLALALVGRVCVSLPSAAQGVCVGSGGAVRRGLTSLGPCGLWDGARRVTRKLTQHGAHEPMALVHHGPGACTGSDRDRPGWVATCRRQRRVVGPRAPHRHRQPAGPPRTRTRIHARVHAHAHACARAARGPGAHAHACTCTCTRERVSLHASACI